MTTFRCYWYRCAQLLLQMTEKGIPDSLAVYKVYFSVLPPLSRMEVRNLSIP